MMADKFIPEATLLPSYAALVSIARKSKSNGGKVGAVWLLGLCLTAMASVSASAQYATDDITDLTAPEVPIVDDYNVNIRSSALDITVPGVTIGQGKTALSYSIQTNGSYFRVTHQDDYRGSISRCDVADQLNYGAICRFYGGGEALQVRFGRVREMFYKNGSTWRPANERGARFEDLGSTCLYTTRDGIRVRYEATRQAGGSHCLSNAIIDVTFPDGRKHFYSRVGETGQYARNIRTNYGVLLKIRSEGFNQGTNNLYDGGLDQIEAVNLAVDYCSESLVYCDFSRSWPTASIQKSSVPISTPENYRHGGNLNDYLNYRTDVVDQVGNRARFTMDSLGRITKYHAPGSPQGHLAYVYCSELEIESRSQDMVNCFDPPETYDSTADISEQTRGGVSSAAVGAKRSYHRNKITEAYRFADKITYMNRSQRDGPSYLPFMRWTAGGSGGSARRVSGTGNASPGLPHYGGSTISVSDNRGNRANYEATNRNWVKSLSSGGQSTMTFTYDNRGNVVKTTQPLSSFPGAPVVEFTASYSSSCSNIVVCNKPNSTTDAKGNTTNYTYDPVHGGVTKITGPADANGIRPQSRFFYTKRHVWTKTSSGGYAKEPTGIWLLTSEEFCRTTAASGNGCAGGAADEVVTTYDYGPDSGPNNLWLRGLAVTADGQTLRTCYRYNAWGAQLSETQPNANLSSCPSPVLVASPPTPAPPPPPPEPTPPPPPPTCPPYVPAEFC